MSTAEMTLSLSAVVKKAERLRNRGEFEQAHGLYARIAQHSRRLDRNGSHAGRYAPRTPGVSALERALKTGGPAASIQSAIGVAKTYLGDFDAARNHFHEAIELDPNCVDAFNNLARAKRFSDSDDLHLRIEELLASNVPNAKERCILQFAAGKIHDDLGHFENAFQHFEKGNQSKRARFDQQQWRHFIDRTANCFDTRHLTRHMAKRRASPRLVFVIGMPRSGTTLIEQTLASHSSVYGAGELPDLSGISKELPRYSEGAAEYPECVRRSAPTAFTGFGDAYIHRVRKLASHEHPCIVDKTPRNFLFVGLMHALFPDVRVVHCQRDPLDNGLSCYSTNFKFGQSFSYDLRDIARYYGAYHRLMQHWTDVAVIPRLDIRYESLVENQETVTRQLLDFVGLPWEDACLSFQSKQRSVPTASSWQVRQPLYTSSVGKWRNYAQFLHPLAEQLKIEGVPLQTGRGEAA